MGQLPPERISQAPAIKYVSLDYAGPLMVQKTHGHPFEKRYIALFNCMSTRAVHLELVCDASAAETVHVIEDFVGRRGTPACILSDNQTSFLAAATVLQEIWSKSHTDALQLLFSQQGIQWKYVPPQNLAGFMGSLSDWSKK